MDRKELIVIPIGILFSFVVALGIFVMFFDVFNVFDLFRSLSYFFVISVTVNFILGVVILLLKFGGSVYSVGVFIGNLSFLFLPLVFGTLDFRIFAKVFFIEIFSFVLFLMFVDLLGIHTIQRKYNFFSLIFSKIFVLLAFTLFGTFLFWDVRFSVIALISLVFGFVLLEIKRVLAVSGRFSNVGGDLILDLHNKSISTLKRELDNSSYLVNALQLQLEVLSNLKKEIYSKIEFIKGKISNCISSLDDYSFRYTDLEENISKLVADYSTHLLSIEYYLSKFKDTLSLANKTINSSYDRISSKVQKKNEIVEVFSQVKHVLDSLLTKVDSIIGILSEVIVNQVSMSKNVNLIFDELGALSVISTNIEIESLKYKGTKTMGTMISEINGISSNIKTYASELLSLYNKFKDIFDYLGTTSQSLLKHSDRIKYNVLLVGETVNDILSFFGDEVSEISSLEAKFDEMSNFISSMYAQLKQFREFLEKISEAVSMISDIKRMLEMIKVSLNDVFIVIEDLQQNVSES